MKWLIVGATVFLIGIGSAVAQPPPPGYAPVPPPRVEVMPPPPGRGVVWQPGHWHWNGFRYVWIRGHYVRRWHHPGRFVPGHWIRRRGQWIWMPAHWR